jgi:hypothetical protein
MYYVESRELKSALSTDGQTFAPENGVRLSVGKPGELDAAGIIHPSIVQLKDGTYRLYYDGVEFESREQPAWRIMSASSKDGLNWVKDSGARIPVDKGEVDTTERFKFEMAFSAHADVEEDGSIALYFSAQGEPIKDAGIWRARSTDGVNFVVETKPVLGREPGFGNKKEGNPRVGPKGVPQDPLILHLSEGDRLFYWTPDGGTLSAFRAQNTQK